MRLENVRLELLFSWDYLAGSKEQMEKISITGMKCSSYHRTQDLWMQATTTLLLTVCTQTGILMTKEKLFLWEEAMLNRLCSAVNWTHLGNHLWAVCWLSLWRCSSLSSQKTAQCQGHESNAVCPPMQQSTGKATRYLPYVGGTWFSHQLQQDPEQTGDTEQGGGSFAPTSSPTPTQLSTAHKKVSP